MALEVSILSPKEILFEGEAKSLIVPGEQGVFELLSFHKRILSRLISGTLVVDGQSIYIKRGVIKVNQNKVTVLVEE
jgi:F-type H+-transporting ATPase subunit epsilon